MKRLLVPVAVPVAVRVAVVILALVAVTAPLNGCAPVDPVDDDDDTPTPAPPEPDCEPGSRDGDPAGEEDLEADRNILFNLRTPEDYAAERAHPLLLVLSGAGGTRNSAESSTGMTPFATGRGWLVAYADHRSPNSGNDRVALVEIPSIVAERWCVDEDRVFITGHSDGGTNASIGVLLEEVDPPARALASSAAGVNEGYFAAQECRSPVPVMVLHSSNDTLFPGFGADAATWWADCNGCDALPEDPDDDGCAVYSNCDADGATVYCEGSGGHGAWPDRNERMLDFFEANSAD